jgi:hypothetical protein
MSRSLFILVLLFVFLLAHVQPVFATDAVVGTGTPESWTEAAFNNALAIFQSGESGTTTFNDGGTAKIGYPLVVDPFVQIAKLLLSGDAGDKFGSSVALSRDGNTTLVGVPFDDVDGKIDQGSAYVFVHSGSGWIQQFKLLASDGEGGDLFGYSVALSADGNVALVGAPENDAVYVFTRSGSSWSQQAKLTAGNPGDYFGSSVALSGDGYTALVGAPHDKQGWIYFQGMAYVFVRSGTNWIGQSLPKASATGGRDVYGISVSLSADGNTALVGSFNGGGFQGSVSVWIFDGTDWVLQELLIASDGTPYNYNNFGGSVALSDDGNTALIGANLVDVDGRTDQGSAYVFVRNGTTWVQQAQLIALGGAENDYFGSSVALSGNGNKALIGAPGGGDPEYNTINGSAQVFVRSGVNWSQQASLTASDGQLHDRFGNSVALSGNGHTALMGAANDDIGSNADQGSAYLFDLPEALVYLPVVVK